MEFTHWPFFNDSHALLYREAINFASTIHENEDLDHNLQSKDFVSYLAEVGFLKYSVISPYGGIHPQLDVRSLCILREGLAFKSGLLDFAFAMQGLGSGPISLFGNEEQKSKYLPAVAEGKLISAFAISEAEAGSDPSAIKLSARFDGDNVILNGEKTWISNAEIGNLFTVFARSEDIEGAKGISAFIVEAPSPGLSATGIELSSPHPVGTLKFNDCKIPANNLIGKRGEGFKIAMATLDVFRSTVGAAALGFAKRAFHEARNYAKERSLFGEKLSDFQMTKERLSDMAMHIEASSLLIYRAAWEKDSGKERINKEASMAKLYGTEAAQKVIDAAVQMLGARGVVKGEIVERLYRDIRPLRIYEGATEIQKLIIAKELLQ